MTVGRIAGDSDHYQFALVRDGSKELTAWGFQVPSVTSILTAVLGKPAGAMAHWGYNLAIEGMLTLAQLGDISGMTEEQAKEHLKAAEYSPNKVRDKAGDRGSNAHRLLELLANGYEHTVVGNLATFTKDEGAVEAIVLDGYCFGVIAWWDHEMAGWTAQAVEVPVWSMRHRFCGTIDLARRDDDSGFLELVDLKTHKPKTQAFPAYLADLFQLAAYRLAWSEVTGEMPATNQVLVVDEKGRYFTDTRMASTESFLLIRELYDVLAELGEHPEEYAT